MRLLNNLLQRLVWPRYCCGMNAKSGLLAMGFIK